MPKKSYHTSRQQLDLQGFNWKMNRKINFRLHHDTSKLPKKFEVIYRNVVQKKTQQKK